MESGVCHSVRIFCAYNKNIIEVNFTQYIDVLSDILVKYAVNFRLGRQWVVPLSANIKRETVLLWLLDFCLYIYF